MNTPEHCPLCQHPESRRISCDRHLVMGYGCPRCGDYFISEILLLEQPATFEKGNFKLACIAFEWHLHNPRTPFVLIRKDDISYSPAAAFPKCRIFTFSEMQDAFPTGAEIVERAMLNLARMVDHPIEQIGWDLDALSYPCFTPSEAVYYLICDLDDAGYVKIAKAPFINEDITIGLHIAPEGWRQIEKWRGRYSLADSKQAFVAMWFADEMKPVYDDGIAPAVKDAGFEPKRIDNVEHNNKIDDEIAAEIRKSRFIVADITAGKCEQCATCDHAKEPGKECRDMVRPRGGVYFEAGFAMGLGKPVIWTVRKGQDKEMHFDTRQYKHIIYENPADLRQQLLNRIRASIT